MTSFTKLVGGIYEEKIMQSMQQILLIGLLQCLSTAYAGQVGSPNPNIYSPTNSPIQGATIAPTAANSSDSYRYLVFQEEWDAFHKNDAEYREALSQLFNELNETCDPSSDECQRKLAESGAQAKILERWREAITLGIEALKEKTVEELRKLWGTADSNTGATLYEKFYALFKDERQIMASLQIYLMRSNKLGIKCVENIYSDECSRSEIAETDARIEALKMREESLAREGEALARQAAEEMRRRRWSKFGLVSTGIGIVAISMLQLMYLIPYLQAMYYHY